MGRSCMDPGQIRSRLLGLEGRSRAIREAITNAMENGLAVDYPLLAWRILEDFRYYAEQDLRGGEVERANTAVEELSEIEREAESRVREILSGEEKTGFVPRYLTSTATIVNGHFEATRLLQGGKREHGPVIFTGYGHFDQVRKDIPKFHDYGANIIQIEIGPSSTILEGGEINTGALDDLVTVFDRAAGNNVAVNLLLSPHYMPRWALDRYPHLSKCEGGFIRFCIDAPESKEIIEKHIRATVRAVADKPALHSICLTNEPVYRTCHDDGYTRELWERHLRGRFGDDIESARDTLRTEVAKFRDFPIPDWHTVEATPLFYEWCTFNQLRFAGWHRWMADIIHSISPGLHVHAKIMPTFLWRKNVADGVNPALFSELSDINGNDCWCMYEHGEGQYAQDWIWQNIFYDMLRSFGNKPVFNSENHIIKDRERGVIPPEHVRTALWQGAIHGQGATTIWVWERTFDPESDFAGSIMHRPLCARAAGETALDLMRLSREVARIQEANPGAGILYSMPSMVYQDGYPEELRNSYEALNFTGNRIAFVQSENLLDDGSLPPLIIIPMATHVEEVTVWGLSRYVENGGKLVLLGEGCLQMSEHNRPNDVQLPVETGRVMQMPSGQGAFVLRKALLKYLPPLSIYPSSGGDSLAWGIEWLEARDGERRIINAVNLLRSEIAIKWSGMDLVNATDLITGQKIGEEMVIRPLDPLLIEING